MRIAVTYENGAIFQHFGKTAQFKLYDAENGQIVRTEIVGTNGAGHGALAGFLREHAVETLICGGIGGGAQEALWAAGITLSDRQCGRSSQRTACAQACAEWGAGLRASRAGAR